MENSIGKKLKNYRVKAGYSQEELAGQAGVSLRTVQRFENGETTPRGDTIKRLFQIFGKSPEEVLDWSHEENKGFLYTLVLSGLLFLFSPLLGLVIPLVLWLNRRNKIAGVDYLGKKLINFQLTLLIPYYTFRLISYLRMIPSLNHGEVNIGYFQNSIKGLLWVTMIVFGLVILLTAINAYRLYKNQPAVYFGIPFIK
ncbi:helix-turn-helix domain-containing protein [Algoriphagus sp.]|uniref:helix-turn-helix domain-containing protein n=1 Tax=Algoriphagus sp. TaxID=1872435 RepID=UPI00262FD417|nr:helix-turn-helix domain-containing protein [Algoriphagus sp.]